MNTVNNLVRLNQRIENLSLRNDCVRDAIETRRKILEKDEEKLQSFESEVRELEEQKLELEHTIVQNAINQHKAFKEIKKVVSELSEKYGLNCEISVKGIND